MSARTLHEDPMTWPVLQEIAEATKASVLHNLTTNVIPNVVGITGEQRRQLFAAVHNRFCQLNAAAMKPGQPRW